jgi:hypothetical protein
MRFPSITISSGLEKSLMGDESANCLISGVPVAFDSVAERTETTATEVATTVAAMAQERALGERKKDFVSVNTADPHSYVIRLDIYSLYDSG